MSSVSKKLYEPNAEVIGAFSERQHTVFLLTGQGYTTTEIAETLGVDPSTIETYYERIKKKLGIHNARELVRDAAIWWYLHRD